VAKSLGNRRGHTRLRYVFGMERFQWAVEEPLSEVLVLARHDRGVGRAVGHGSAAVVIRVARVPHCEGICEQEYVMEVYNGYVTVCM
jgi:hypothetical protein